MVGTAANLRSPIRWAGSKRKLLPILEKFWRSSDNKYIEAFAGSACLFFHVQPRRAVLNDTNEELIAAYRILARHPLLLYETLNEMTRSQEIYYQIRGVNVNELDEFDAAVRFFYLNRYCFNGIYRTNKLGAFNVPYASYKTGGFPKRDQWRRSAEALSRAMILCSDFEEVVLDNVESGDFVYLDPPYAVSNRRVFVQYSPNEFGMSDLTRLRSVMDYVDRAGATFVVSYALSKETSILSQGWHSKRTLAQRNVAGFSHHRRKAVEVLITNDSSRLV